MASSRTRTNYAILGFLADENTPLSGYDIKKAIDKSVGFFWNEGYGKIYPMLKKLLSEGLISKVDDEVTSGRNKIRYSITPEGTKELKEWIISPGGPVVLKNELLLKLFFGRQVGLSNSLKHLEEFQLERHRILRGYQQAEKDLQIIEKKSSAKKLAFYHSALLYGIKFEKMQLQWVKETMAMLEELK